MRPPRFWSEPAGIAAALLAPAAAAYAAATAHRVARPAWRAPIPVICCGNASVGGAGKTTLALDLGRRLTARGKHVAFLSRGYGGTARGTVRVASGARGEDVGDEPRLLAAVAPTFIGADRAETARAAIAEGAEILVMDDGLQNPTLAKTLSLLVIDGEAGFGNGRVLPAGPLREPVVAAAARCAAAVVIGRDCAPSLALLPPALPRLRADLRSAFDPARWDRPLHAFAGIARPEKFFASLEAAGARLAGRTGFPDHHRFTAAELDALLAAAARAGAIPVTTPKDAARLPAAYAARIGVIGVDLVWDAPAEIEALLDQALAGCG